METRDKNSQKISLRLYRQESEKILKIISKFSDQVEKASIDEAYIDVTSQVEEIYAMRDKLTFDDRWHDSLFMGHEKGQGNFMPETEEDKKLFIANGMTAKIR